ncbi:hypothetical protein [Rathayibacter sp. Leaf248]|uniref:hypothetical protein n=1 Tax=Rathayibacter sp. Leaf248 TaxID=2876555 RepID=UPI001E49DBC6|nr:hypothetical protein [Rathayibacter sp. Leaf248]
MQARDLDKVARNELKTLTKENADWVAMHLVMAGRLLEEDPELAHRHVLSAARRAGRIAVVRESLAISAYAIGDFALALRELRTYRRISGSDEQVPLMVDSERGVGRPDKALELGRSIDRSALSVGAQVSLAIAMSGARLDLGQTELALMELEIPQLDPNKAFSYSPDLFAAYAAVLEELGRTEEAAQWQRRADVAARAVFAAEGGGDDETIEVVEEEGEAFAVRQGDDAPSAAVDDESESADSSDDSDGDDEDDEDDLDEPSEADEPIELDDPADPDAALDQDVTDVELDGPALDPVHSDSDHTDAAADTAPDAEPTDLAAPATTDPDEEPRVQNPED